MTKIIALADKRQPVYYTLRIAHHWDGTIEVWVEDIANDDRSHAAVAHVLQKAAEAFSTDKAD